MEHKNKEFCQDSCIYYNIQYRYLLIQTADRLQNTEKTLGVQIRLIGKHKNIE